MLLITALFSFATLIILLTLVGPTLLIASLRTLLVAVLPLLILTWTLFFVLFLAGVRVGRRVIYFFIANFIVSEVISNACARGAYARPFWFLGFFHAFFVF